LINTTRYSENKRFSTSRKPSESQTRSSIYDILGIESVYDMLSGIEADASIPDGMYWPMFQHPELNDLNITHL